MESGQLQGPLEPGGGEQGWEMTFRAIAIPYLRHKMAQSQWGYWLWGGVPWCMPSPLMLGGTTAGCPRGWQVLLCVGPVERETSSPLAMQKA